MGNDPGNKLVAGRDAIGRHDWRVAYELFTEVDGNGGLDTSDLELMAEAAWWTGRLDEAVAHRERAFSERVTQGEPLRAATIAMALAKDYFAKGTRPIGTAWMRRAERLLADEPESAELGWLERLRSSVAVTRGDFSVALDHARRAYELAAEHGDPELLAVSLHDQGRALVLGGDVEEGMALIEEATIPAVAGELSAYNTSVVYCNTITACTELADFRRAGDWADAASRWCERNAVAGFPGMCRVYRASIMLMRGAWEEAEQEAQRALGELPAFNVGLAAEAFYELGEIRLRAGDLDGAGTAFKQAHELGRDPQPGLALLRLMQGKTDSAETCIVSALDTESRDLQRARLLPARVAVALAAGDLEQARVAADELEAISARYGSEALRAATSSARAELTLASGDSRAAITHARAALRLWQEIDAPYDAAQARVLLGSAYAALDAGDDAVLELEAAAKTFERLGAVRDRRTTLEALGRLTSVKERRNARATRTFVFTDIVRSTDLVEAIGDGAWLDLVRWHDKTLRSLFAAHDGEEIDHTGDGFFVAFRDSESAVACSVAIQRTLASHRREHGFAPQVRIGLHATEAEAEGATFRGRGVHEAARISALAQGGEIVASLATVEEADGVSYSDPRPVELKGIEEPIVLVAVDWR